MRRPPLEANTVLALANRYEEQDDEFLASCLTKKTIEVPSDTCTIHDPYWCPHCRPAQAVLVMVDDNNEYCVFHELTIYE